MMKKTLINSKHILKGLSLLMIVFMVSSCCPEKDLSLTEIKVCSTAAADLEDTECDSSQSSISTSSLFTVSTLSHNVESDSELTFRVYQNFNGEWVLQDPLTRTVSLSEFEDECGVKSAQEYRPATEWPVAEVRVEVELNSDPVQVLTRTFNLE